MTDVLLEKFSSFASLDSVTLSARLHNCSFPAPPEVPVFGPSHGQDPSFPTHAGIVGSHRELQGDGMDRVPSGSQPPFPSASVAGPAQPEEVRGRARVAFDLPLRASPVAPDAEEEEDDDRNSVVSNPMVADHTLLRLVNFIYDKSCPLSSPSLASSRSMWSPTRRRLRVPDFGCIPGWRSSWIRLVSVWPPW